MKKSSAHLRTLREATRLDEAQAAAYVGVPLATWQSWESPQNTSQISPDVEEKLLELVEVIERHLDQLDQEIEGLPPRQEVALIRYRSDQSLQDSHPGLPGGLLVHNAVIAASLQYLLMKGLNAVVIWDDHLDSLIGQDWAP